MKAAHSLIVAALVATGAIAATAASAPDEGTPFTKRSVHMQDEGMPPNLLAGHRPDEGTPPNLIAFHGQLYLLDDLP